MTLKVRKKTASIISKNTGMAEYLPVSTRSIFRLRVRARLSWGLTTVRATAASMKV